MDNPNQGIRGRGRTPNSFMAAEDKERENNVRLLNEAKVQAEQVKTSIKTDDYNLEIIEDFDSAVDPTVIPKPDPRYEYHWLRDRPENLSNKTSNMLYQLGGWQLVQKDHALRIGMKEKQEIGTDGLVRKNDLVLAFMPKDIFVKKQEYKRRKAATPMNAIQRLMKKGNPSIGGKEIHPSMKGLQTADQLGMSET